MPSPQRYWREIPQRYRLEAGKCAKCGSVHFPPRVICPDCKSREFKTVQLPDHGTIDTFTVIHVGTSQFTDQVPYAVGIVELEGGVKITTQIVDCDTASLKIGQPVRVAFRKIMKEGEGGILCYGYKCVPA